MSDNICSHENCRRQAPLGLGWGLSTRLVQWYCAEHYVPALARLGRLLESTFGSQRLRRAA